MNLKWLFKVFTTRDWRGHKRRVFFENIFENIKEDCADGVRCETFNLKNSAPSYRNSCHEMAATYDYNPLFDKSFDLNIGRFMSMYHPQSFDSLYARIERISSPWKILTKKTGYFLVKISGKEDGKRFSFSYKKNVKF